MQTMRGLPWSNQTQFSIVAELFDPIGIVFYAFVFSALSSMLQNIGGQLWASPAKIWSNDGETKIASTFPSVWILQKEYQTGLCTSKARRRPAMYWNALRVLLECLFAIFFFVVVVCEHKQCKRGTKSSKLYQFG
jgi:hypothetical protein